jgi:nitroreductase
MEFSEVVRRRRMVRRYSPEPVDRTVLDRVLSSALRAPSAGFSQGWAFLVLEDPGDVQRFWQATSDPGDLESPDEWMRGMTTAPVVVVPLSSKQAYLERYSEADKGWTDKAEARWPVPYWDLDTAMASLLILLSAVDEGLGACFFGVPTEHVDPLREAFGIPEEYKPIGAITLGHRTDDPGVPGSAATRRRKSLEEVVHRGRWS